MAGIFTRPAIDKIENNPDLTPEQRTEQIFTLFGRALDDGYVSKSAAEEAKNQAVEAAKAGIKIPDPIDPKTTPEYMEVARERDMLRTINGEDFQGVKSKFREIVFNSMDHGEKAASVADQLAGIKENFPEYFVPDEPPKDNQPVNTPVYSKGPGNTNVNPESEEDKLAKQLLDQWK